MKIMVIPRNDCWRQARVWFFLHAENLALKEDHIYNGWLEPNVAFPFLPNESTNPPSQTPIYQTSTTAKQNFLDHFHLQQLGWQPTSFLYAKCVHCDFAFDTGLINGHWWDSLILHFVSGQCAWMQMCCRYPPLISRWIDQPLTLFEISQCSGFEQAWAKMVEYSQFKSDQAKEKTKQLVKTMFPDKCGFTSIQKQFDILITTVFQYSSFDDRWKAFCKMVIFDDDESKEKCRVYFDKMTPKQ